MVEINVILSYILPMKRKLYQSLLHWKQKKNRNPLILNGVRQVGKTYLLRKFGEEHFPKYHYLNFEKNIALDKIFEPDLDPHRIINEIQLFLRTTINAHEDLLIFDEIQASPRALTSLKYFCEDMSELALCSAGSLLGIHLNEQSYPVGKTDSLTLHPMSFEEFLLATSDKQTAEFFQSIQLDSKISAIAHERLWQQLKIYFVVGGLPEVVALYNDQKADFYAATVQVRQKQNELIKDYYADMAKHSGKVNAMHLDRLWRNVPIQLAYAQHGAATKFKFKGIVPGIDRYARLVNVLDWLENAGLIIKTYLANKARTPLVAHTKENTFKLFMFDVGILGAIDDIEPKTILDYDYGSYKGYFAENFVAQEFLCAADKQLFGWQEGTSEIEFIKQIENEIIPIEVKSGWITQAKSLKVFADKYHPAYRVVLSANNLYIDHTNKIHRYPLYLAGKFPLTS